MNLVYLVHNLHDPAVERRLRLLTSLGIAPKLLGFHRGNQAIAAVAGVSADDLGQTVNARFARRIASLLSAGARIGRWKGRFIGAEMIVARNLEMLALATYARARYAPGATLAYECLDVHTMLVGSGLKARMARAVEGWLLAKCRLLIVSSPAFVTEHFLPRYGRVPQTLLAENKILAFEFDPSSRRAAQPGRPWRIGWFGVIRCRLSLDLLCELLRARPGKIEVIIRGKPSLNVIPDFHEIVAATPGMSFLGAYDRNRDLAAIYHDVDFTWALDFYEAGANSQWLLPNRLYEGGAYGAVHLADAQSETGRWLQRHNVGALLNEPLSASLRAFFDGLDQTTWQKLRQGLLDLDPAHFVSTPEDAASFMAALASARD